MKTSKKQKEYYALIGEAIVKGFSKAMSHPYIKLDMCPDFSNLLIITLGRSMYKLLSSKKMKRLLEKGIK